MAVISLWDVSVNEVLVIGVGPDAKPVHSAGNFCTNGAVMQANPHRPESAN